MSGEKRGFFKKFLGSIKDFSVYKDFAKERFSKAFGYFIILCLLFTAVGSVMPVYRLHTGIQELSAIYNEQVPDFILENGQLQIDIEKPFVYEDEDGLVGLYIDPQNTIDESVLDGIKSGFLITREDLVIKNDYEIQKFRWADLQDVTFTKTDLGAYIPYLEVINIFIVFFYFVFLVIAKLFSTLFIALLGLIPDSKYKTNLGFGKLYTIGLYALTLPTLVQILFRDILSFPLPFMSIIYLGISLVIMFQALKHIAEEQKLQTAPVVPIIEAEAVEEQKPIETNDYTI